MPSFLFTCRTGAVVYIDYAKQFQVDDKTPQKEKKRRAAAPKAKAGKKPAAKKKGGWGAKGGWFKKKTGK